MQKALPAYLFRIFFFFERERGRGSHFLPLEKPKAWGNGKCRRHFLFCKTILKTMCDISWSRIGWRHLTDWTPLPTLELNTTAHAAMSADITFFYLRQINIVLSPFRCAGLCWALFISNVTSDDVRGIKERNKQDVVLPTSFTFLSTCRFDLMGRSLWPFKGSVGWTVLKANDRLKLGAKTLLPKIRGGYSYRNRSSSQVSGLLY